MSTDLIAIATLAAFGLIWAYLNMKIRAKSGKRVSLWLMWAFMLAASAAVVRLAWGALT